MDNLPVNTMAKKFSGFLALFLLLFWSSPGLTANATTYDGKGSLGIQQTSSAYVVVNGDELFDVVGIRAFPARKRAKRISKRIEDLAADENVNPAEIKLVEKADRVEIVYGDVTLFGVFDIDAKHQGVDNKKVVAETYILLLRNAIEAYRLARTPKVLMKNASLAVLRTLVLAVILFGLHWLFKRVDIWLEKYFKRRIKKLEARSMRVVQAEQVWHVIQGVIRLVKTILVLGVVYTFLNIVLKLFPWTRYYAQELLQLIIDPLVYIVDGIVGYLPSLFFLIILYFVTRYILKLLHTFFDAVSLGNLRLNNFEGEWAWPTYRIVRGIIIVFAVVIAYPYIPGSNSEAFKGISLFVGVLLSLGSSSVISNIIAGYTMTYRRAFRIGDRVRIGDTVGDVIETRVLVTYLRSLKNENVVIPNSKILGSEVINYTTLAKEEGLILHTSVGIGYETPWRQVEAMLLEAASRTSAVIQDPAPFVLQKSLTDFAVIYELNAYCKKANQMSRIYSNIHQNIQDVFNEYDVQIMTPHYVADTPDAKLVPVENWYIPPASKAGDETQK